MHCVKMNYTDGVCDRDRLEGNEQLRRTSLSRSIKVTDYCDRLVWASHRAGVVQLGKYCEARLGDG